MHYFYIYTVYTYHIHLSWINWIFICSIMQHLSSQPQRWQADVSDQLALVEGQSNWVLCGAMGVGWVSVGSLCRGLCKVYIYIKNHGLPWFINVHHIYDKANQPGFHNLHSGPPNLRPQPGVGQSDLEVRHWVAKRFASWTSGDPVGQLNHSSHFSYHLTSFNRLDFLHFFLSHPFTKYPARLSLHICLARCRVTFVAGWRHRDHRDHRATPTGWTDTFSIPSIPVAFTTFMTFTTFTIRTYTDNMDQSNWYSCLDIGYIGQIPSEACEDPT